MNIIVRKRFAARHLSSDTANIVTPPKRGESFSREIPADESGIRNFEVPQMVQYVKQFNAMPRIVKLARRIVSICPAKDKLCEMNALFLWVKNHMRYVNDPVDKEVIATAEYHLDDLAMPPDLVEAILGKELLQQMEGFGVQRSALGMKTNVIHCKACFEQNLSGPRPTTSGDCDEGATLLSTLLAAVGIVPRFRFGGTEDSKSSDGCNYHHVWVQANDGRGSWIDMDVTEAESKLGWFYPHFTCFGATPIWQGMG